MAHKTKAEKIAASLRSNRNQATHSSSITAAQHSPVLKESGKAQKSASTVYDSKDLLKTLAATLFILALMALVYVLQLRGYIQ